MLSWDGRGGEEETERKDDDDAGRHPRLVIVDLTMWEVGIVMVLTVGF